MDLAEVEESFFAISDAKLHGGMCKTLLGIYCRTMNIFPALEAARPRSRSGIQALCSLHVALEKAKSILQHCCECSKLYLAITGDSILLKFERAKCSLVDSLKRVEDIVPSSIGCQVLEIVIELEGTVFAHDPFEKQVGEDIISLLQRGRRFDDDTTFDNKELECFHEAAGKLGINSSRAALAERRALKKLIERAQMEGDKRKESIVAYLLHLMRKYSKLFIRSDLAGGGDDNDSQGSSTPCSPTVQDGVKGGRQTAFDRQISKLNSFNFRPSLRFRSNDYRRYSGHIPIPPEELRCPISLQLMFDPVIVASGQTYEKVCIEKWFNDGHNTCPKTQQQLSHIWVTPNYCVKGLIASWCEQHGVPIPDGPPESLDLNYWRLALSDSESAKSRSETTTENDNSNSNISKGGGIKVVPLEESAAVAMIRGGNTINDNGVENGPTTTREMHVVREEEDEEEEGRSDVIYEKYVDVLYGDESLERKCIVVEKIRKFLKDDEEARNFMGDLGCVQALVRFLRFAVHERSQLGQEVGAMALFNIAVSNNRNKELMVSAGVIPILEDMINNPDSHGLVAALYLNLSCLEQAKPILGSGSSTKAVPFLIKLLLSSRTDPQSKQDSLHSLYNLSSHTRNIPFLLESGIITAIHTLLREPREHGWTEKSIAVLNNLGMTDTGKEAIVSSQGLMGELASILDVGEVLEQEQAVACLLTLCSDNDQKCIEMALDEGVIPALVSISVNGTTRGRDKSQKLLMVFRERRQQEYCSSTTSPPRQSVVQEMAAAVVIESSEKEMKRSNSTVVPTTARQQEQHKGNGTTRSLVKSISSRKLGRSFSFFSKCRNQSTRR